MNYSMKMQRERLSSLPPLTKTYCIEKQQSIHPIRRDESVRYRVLLADSG